MKLYGYLALVCSIASLSSCKDTVVSAVPDSRVYLELNTTAAGYNNLNSSLLYTICFEKVLIPDPTGGNSIQNINYTETGNVRITSTAGMDVTRPLNYNEGIGYSGIIIINGFDNTLAAFDMCCPYEHKKFVKVRMNDMGKATCDSCKTVYDIANGIGNPESGPSKESLRRYKITSTGYWLYITR